MRSLPRDIVDRCGIVVRSATPGYCLQPHGLLLHLHDAIAEVEAPSWLELQ